MTPRNTFLPVSRMEGKACISRSVSVKLQLKLAFRARTEIHKLEPGEGTPSARPFWSGGTAPKPSNFLGSATSMMISVKMVRRPRQAGRAVEDIPPAHQNARTLPTSKLGQATFRPVEELPHSVRALDICSGSEGVWQTIHPLPLLSIRQATKRRACPRPGAGSPQPLLASDRRKRRRSCMPD